MIGSVFIEAAPAKINLTLEVLGRRADGYHELDSIVTFARNVGDRIELRPEDGSGIMVVGPFSSSIMGENIVARAISALAGYGITGGAVIVDKRLPVASGIGGGSADAAAALRAARRAFPNSANAVPWTDIAASLGADVTACLADAPLRIVGTGSHIQLLPSLPMLHAVLVNPMTPVPADKTARVFQTLGLQTGKASRHRPDSLPAFDDARALMTFIAGKRNDLTAAAASVVPAIVDVLATLEASPGCQVARLSGAGPTCFGVFDTMEVAQSAALRLRVAHPTWWVEPTRLG